MTKISVFFYVEKIRKYEFFNFLNIGKNIFRKSLEVEKSFKTVKNLVEK